MNIELISFYLGVIMAYFLVAVLIVFCIKRIVKNTIEIIFYIKNAPDILRELQERHELAKKAKKESKKDENTQVH